MRHDVHVAPSATSAAGAGAKKDHFITRKGLTYAGSHIVADLTGCKVVPIQDEELKRILIRAVKAAGATLLYTYVLEVGPGHICAFAVLAESHITAHIWPSSMLVIADFFMCGEAVPREALVVFKEEFQPTKIVMGEHKRGVV